LKCTLMIFISDGSFPFVISKSADYFWKQIGSLLGINEVGFVFRGKLFENTHPAFERSIFCFNYFIWVSGYFFVCLYEVNLCYYIDVKYFPFSLVWNFK
jgi:hypothetical protein